MERIILREWKHDFYQILETFENSVDGDNEVSDSKYPIQVDMIEKKVNFVK